MNILFFIASIGFFIFSIRNIFFWTHLWQLKEYRFDRMRAHLLETSAGKDLFYSPRALLKLIGILAYVFVVLSPAFLLWYETLITGIYVIAFCAVIYEISSRTIRRPVPTKKALLIAFVSFVFLALLYQVPIVDRFLWLLLIEKLVTFFIAGLIAFLWIPTEFYRDIQLERAMAKLAKNKKVLTIGVTGSYGKSSTKEYIAQILEKKFRVVKTQGNNNTPIGIANTILSGVSQNTQVFIAEMGAYKKGEIAELCEIVKPRIGIVTGINDQHASLFGSLRNVMDGKYELIESLPNNGIGLFNGNNEYVAKLYKKTKRKKVLYATEDSPVTAQSDSIRANNIVAGKKAVFFAVQVRNKSFVLKTPLIGKQAVENILPAVYIGNYLGMSEKELKDAVASLAPLKHTMNYQKLPNGAVVIDDTFTTNPHAVFSAVEYMKLYKGKKIMVLHPMIELGLEAEKEHIEIGKKIGSYCSHLFVTNPNFLSAIQKGILAVKSDCVVSVLGPFQISQFLQKNLRKEDVVVFEGREARMSLVKII